VNGSFYHHHSDPSFQRLHPNLDLEPYCLSKPLRAEYPELARGRRSNTPQPGSPEPVKLPSSPPLTLLHPAYESLDEVIKVGDTEEDQIGVDAALAAALPQDTTEASQDDVVAEFPVQHSTYPREDALDETELRTVEGFDDNDDSGIILEDIIVSDTEDFVEDATYADTFDGAGTSQSEDSVYGTQPSQDIYDTLPEMDGHSTDDTRMTGNRHTKSSNSSDRPSETKASQFVEQPRKKPTPKIPAPNDCSTRRSIRHSTCCSSRPSQMELPPDSPDAATTPSLGKHERDANEDSGPKVEEPKPKRNKPTVV
jgi:hypothetical protein